MDFDQLLYHHQMVLIAVSRARRDGHPPSSFDLSDSYARRIAEYRDRRGLDDGPADKRRPGSARLKADPTTSEQATGYADFLGDTFIAELLIHKALSMTPQERSASALEDIVDRLAEIEEARWVIGRDIYRSLGYDEMALAALADNISLDDGGSSSAVNPGSAWPSTDKDIARGHTGQLPLETWRNVNIHDERAELLRQRIRERSLSEQADAPDREQVISRAMLDAENRYGNASEQFAVDEEAGAVRLGDRGAAHIWQIVGERLHTLHDIGRPPRQD